MPRFSANLGFLWPELPLEEAIRAAASAGFDAVECHWPYDRDPALVRAALEETGLAMLGLNTATGGEGLFGLLALTDEEKAARASIDQAVAYAAAIGAAGIHAMAGIAQGPEAEATFRRNLRYAGEKAAEHGITILIEPINSHDVPGYFLGSTRLAERLIADTGLANLRLMFDCYHVARMGEDVLARLEALLPVAGHIQFASVPDRGPPDHGELDYGKVFARLDELGWRKPLGAEYRPQGETQASLSWLAAFRR